MTIDEAIKLLLCATGGFPANDTEPYYEAIELGIEALKSVKRDRFDPSTYHPYPLPGETPDG